MTHKLQPSKFIEIILTKPANQNNFTWEPASMRAERFDYFIDDLEAKFAVIDWDWNDIDREKIEILALLGDSKLREIIRINQSEMESIKYEDLVKNLKKFIFEDSNQLLLLAQALNVSQNFNEPLKNFYNRVDTAHGKVDWDTLTSGNIREVLMAVTLARGTSNVFLRGCCTAVKTFKDVNVNRIREEGLKNDTSDSNHGWIGGFDESLEEARFYSPRQGLFGNPKGSGSGGVFGLNSNITQAQGFGSQQGGGLFGSTQAQGFGSQQGGGLFGSTQAQGFGSQQGGGLFGSTQSQGFGSGQGGGLFGSTQAQGFGSQQGGGLFGSQTNVGGIFGSSFNKKRGAFGSSQQPNLFGNNQQSQNSNLCFGTSNNSGLFAPQTQKNPFNDNLSNKDIQQAGDLSDTQGSGESSAAQETTEQETDKVTENTEDAKTLDPSDI